MKKIALFSSLNSMVLCNIFKNNFALEQMKINTLNPGLVIDVARRVHNNKMLIKIES